jgi:protein gp37
MGSLHRARVFLGSLMDIFDPEVKIEWLADALQVVNDCKDLDFLLVTKRPEFFSQRITDVFAWEHEYRGRSGFAHHWLMGKAPANVWMITSTENQEMADKRIPHLLKIPAAVHGLSCEPLLGPIELLRSLNGYDRLGYRKPFEKLLKSEGVDWVIAGGESGASARPMDVQWMHEIQKQCQAAGVAYFAKQLGSFPITENANLHDWPDSTRLVNGCTDGAAAACAELKDKKGGKMEEWPPELCVRQWPSVNR